MLHFATVSPPGCGIKTACILFFLLVRSFHFDREVMTCPHEIWIQHIASLQAPSPSPTPQMSSVKTKVFKTLQHVKCWKTTRNSSDVSLKASGTVESSYRCEPHAPFDRSPGREAPPSPGRGLVAMPTGRSFPDVAFLTPSNMASGK